MLVFLIILAVVVLLLMIRIKFRVGYNCDGFKATLRILFYKMKIPPEKKEKKESPPAEQKEKKESPPAEQKEKKGAPMSELKDIIGIGFKMLGKALKKIRIDKISADVTIASEDAFKTAMLFGSAAAGVGIIIPPIENNFNIRKKDIRVNADFEEKEILVSFDAKVSIAIWQILQLGIIFVWRYIKLKKKKEGKI